MQYTLSTVSAFVAALSLASAAPMPQAATSQDVIIVRQLAAFDSASTITAKLDATTVNNGKVKAAAVSSAGPWCAGFTDAQATKPATALNGDGIFDSENPAVYAGENDAIRIGSWWCAATRPEVETFVQKALGGGKKGGKNSGKTTPAPAEPVNNGGNNNGNNNNNGGSNSGNNGAAAVTVRVQIQKDAAATEFTQEELPANVGLQAASTIRGLGRVADVTLVSSNGGECDFIDANGQAINFAQVDGLVTIAAFVCET